MSKEVAVIKTLPHLIPLFIPKDRVVCYAPYYSIDIVRYLENLKLYTKKTLTFTNLMNLLNNIETSNDSPNQVRRVNSVTEKLEYAIKGDTISFWPIGYRHPIKAEFFGEEIESLYTYDEGFGRRVSEIDHVLISKYIPDEKTDINAITFSFPKNEEGRVSFDEIVDAKFIFTSSLAGVDRNEFSIFETDFTYPQLFWSKLDLLKQEISRLENQGYAIFINTHNQEHIPSELKKYTNIKVPQLKSENHPFISTILKSLPEHKLAAGFISQGLKLAVFTDRELFGSIFLTRPDKLKSSSTIKKMLRQFEGNIEIGDYVVHEDYGVAIYSGLRQEEIDNEMQEYLLLKYANDDELYVPLNQIEKITKYIGNEGQEPRITRLGKMQWENIKAKVKKSTGLLARDLVEHYAKREVSKAKPINQNDSKEYKKFEDDFKYIETEDQHRAINEIISDLEKERPMNRLLVGDVGFGKTEVFMRAAFKIIEHGGQVAILAPTTILTSQHYVVFKERFKNFTIRIEYVSRFNSKEKNQKIIDEINEGKVDVVIGTHRLLSNDVKFKNLQLLVVDEEQRFGVKQKEKIKQLNYGVHVLSVSATPIPRTLSMALSSIQDISIISTPPQGRKGITTEIIKDNWNKVAEAIEFEVERGGQIYFLHNEVQSIKSIYAKLAHLLPGIKFITAHGQMRAEDLDKIMTDFYLNKYNCLISTTIIENGLDLPNVNTIIINKSHKFGLSQLYQLRGRVGRSDRQSFCYLLYEGKELKKYEDEMQNPGNMDKKKKFANRKYLDRLQTLVENQDLGAGFRIASRDLEIRGAGNILGEQQSGYISTIGYALYIEMLAQEVEKLKSSITNS